MNTDQTRDAPPQEDGKVQLQVLIGDDKTLFNESFKPGEIVSLKISHNGIETQKLSFDYEPWRPLIIIIGIVLGIWITSGLF